MRTSQNARLRHVMILTLKRSTGVNDELRAERRNPVGEAGVVDVYRRRHHWVGGMRPQFTCKGSGTLLTAASHDHLQGRVTRERTGDAPPEKAVAADYQGPQQGALTFHVRVPA